KDGVTWVNWSSMGGPPSRSEQPIAADAATFEILRDSRYGRDQSTVFCEGKPLDGADPDTFRVVATLKEADRAFVADAQSAWADCERIKGANGASFEALPGDYARDAERVYSWKWPIDGADPQSFTVLPEDTEYARDQSGIWVGSFKLPTTKPDAFRIIGEYYSTDGEQVFYWQNVVNGADVASFHIPKGMSIGRDANTCWYGTRPRPCS
ncbi:MAG: DKNYY domain-containing protein, partial [Henriciella sp.]